MSAYAYNNNSGAAQFASKLGFVPVEGDAIVSNSSAFSYGKWVKDGVVFYLSTDTEGYFQVGGTAVSGGSGANAKVFFDNLTLIYSDKQMDYTGNVAVGKDNWGGTGTYGSVTTRDGRTQPLVEYYQSSDAGTKMSQKVTGLRNGIYELTVYATSHNAWGNHGATLSGDADDVAYIFALPDGGVTLKQFFTARKDGGMSANEPFKVTISGITVEQGSMTIGLALDKGAQTEWQTIQIYSLTRIAGLDLSGLISAYEAALANAKAVDQSKKMRNSIKTALKDAISAYDDGKVDTEDAEALETATSALETATANANTSIASYAIIATGVIPDNSLEGWTCENSNTFHINTWSVEGNPGNDPSNMVTPFIENWVGKGSYLGAGKVYYRLEGLEPGEVYYASALVRSYNEANSDAPNGPNFYINNVETNLSTGGTTFTYNGMSGIYATLGGTATIGEDGILELGVVINEDRNYNWVAFKNVRMQELAVAYNTAVAAAQALEGTIPTDAYAAVESALATYSDITVENIQSINALVETYSALVAPYAAFNALKANANTLKAVENDNASANDAFGNAITTQAAAVENALTVDNIEDVISDLKTDVLTYVGAANPTDGNQFNLTFLLTNPSLEGLPTWQKAEGWDTEQGDGNYQVMKNDAATSEDGTKTAFYEYWSYNAKANDKFNLYTSVTLPEGTYTMNCYAFAKQQDGEAGKTPIQGVYFYANNTQGDVVADNRLTQKSISFVNDAEQEVKIGLKPLSTGNTYNWMGIGYVELYKVPAKVYAISENENYDTNQSGAGKVTLTRTIAADKWNTIWLPFSLTNEELKAKFGADVEVATFSEIPNPEEEGSSTISFDKMETPAISPKVPVLLKTSTAGSVYEFEGRTVVAGTPKVITLKADGYPEVSLTITVTAPAAE